MTQGVYQIKVKGQLGSSRSEWFEGWTIIPEEDNTSVLTGRVRGKAEWDGVLIKMYNLNLSVVSVHYVEPE